MKGNLRFIQSFTTHLCISHPAMPLKDIPKDSELLSFPLSPPF